MPRFLNGFICVCGLFLSCAVPSSTRAAQSVPQYLFQVGHEFTYRSSTAFKHDLGRTSIQQTTTFRVIGKNDDGTWRIVARDATKATDQLDKKPQVEIVHPALQPRDSVVEFARFDISPDGVVTMIGTSSQRSEEIILTKLPSSPDEARAGWMSHDPDYFVWDKFRIVGQSADGQLTIEAAINSWASPSKAKRFRRVITLDPKIGIPTKIQFDIRIRDHQGRGSIELVRTQLLSAEQLQKFIGDVQAYFDVNDRFEQIVRRDNLFPDELDGLLTESAKAFEIAGTQIQDSELKGLLTEEPSRRDFEAGLARIRAERNKSLVGTRSKDWSEIDESGKRHSLESYRGKVVILHCWSSIPSQAAKQIAAHFARQPVVLIGTSPDAPHENTARALRHVGIHFPQLMMRSWSDYKVTTFPSYLILDQQGVIRGYFAGSTREDRDEVINAVEELLKSGGAAKAVN